MDSIDSPPPLSAPSHMAVGAPTAYSPAMSNTNSNASSTIGLNPATTQMMPPSARFSFNSMIAPASVPLDSISASPYEGSHSVSFNVDSVKKKRGRPRKYAPDGNIALGLATTTSVGHGDLNATSDSQHQAKKARGRPRGSGKKQMNALGSGDISCTPHILFAKPGEDVAAKILSFSQLELGQRTVFIISANGTISNVTLRHPEASGGCVSYEPSIKLISESIQPTILTLDRQMEKGQYEIITLSGSFVVSENNGTRSRTGGLSVLLAGTCGQVLGGGVAGMLMAGSQVQVIVGSFLEDDKKPNTSMLNSGFSSGAPSQMMNFGGGTAAVAAAASPPPLGASSGESSAENGGSPLNNRHPGVFNNNSQAIQMQQQMYHHQIWAASQTQQ